MRTLLKLFLWLILLSPFAAALSFWLLLSPEPRVAEQSPLSHADMLQARRLMQQHTRQAGQHDGRREIALTARELALAARLLLSPYVENAIQTRIAGGQLHAEGTLRIPGIPHRPFLNFTLRLWKTASSPPRIDLRLGPLHLPHSAARALLDGLLRLAAQRPEFRLARSLIEDFWLQEERLHLRYRWNEDMAARAYALLGTPHQEAIAHYVRALRRTLMQASTGRELTRILSPLFALARERSGDGDPVDENRILLGVLAAWARPGEGASLLGLPPAHTLPPFRARLRGRTDLARHFLISALLAARSNDALASTASTYKEIDDAVSGKGFSFVDLAADRAGSRFGALATRPDSAPALQTLIAAGVSEDDLLPPVDRLTEGLDLDRFRHDYRDLGSPRYRAVLARIDRRIARCRLYRSLSGDH